MPRRFALLVLLAACSGLCAAQTNEEKLIAHRDEFRPEVIKVTEGVWVAVGYALANSILIEGTDGVIIVDTTESKNAARAIKAEFDKLTTKPVKAIINTHNHYDHINGSEVFAGTAKPEVIAHQDLEKFVVQSNAEIGNAMRPRNLATPLHMAPGKSRIEPQPLGVIGIISPWNYPMQLAFSPAAAALGAGNRVMIKPSELTRRSAERTPPGIRIDGCKPPAGGVESGHCSSAHSLQGFLPHELDQTMNATRDQIVP